MRAPNWRPITATCMPVALRCTPARPPTKKTAKANALAPLQGADDHPPATDRRRHAAKQTSNRGRKTANTKPSPAKLTEHELETALVAAKTADDVCAAVTRAVYAEQHDGAKCPDKRVPKWTEMVHWWHRAGPQSLAREARKALCVVLEVSWLTLYDLTGAGPIQTRGRGAPLAQRLFVEVSRVHALPRLVGGGKVG